MDISCDIDEGLLRQAMNITGLPTERAALEDGLRLLIRVQKQRRVLELFGKVDIDDHWEYSRDGRCLDRG